MDAALAKNLPRRSRSPHGFTHGRVTVKDKMSFIRVNTTGKTRVKNPLMRERPRLRSLCAVAGMSAFALYPLRLDTPCTSQNIQDLGLDGRASRDGLSSRYSETRSARLIRPDGFYGLQPASRGGQRLESFPPSGVSPKVKTPPVENSQDFGRRHSQASQRKKHPSASSGCISRPLADLLIRVLCVTPKASLF
jgi:hypothetical protein